MPREVLAFETLDCAKKLRIHYRLTSPLEEALLARYPRMTATVQRFSELVAGAKDHVTLTQGQSIRAAGVLGEPKLVVTYAKQDEERPVAAIETFEATLRDVYGAIKRVSTSERQDVV